MNTGEKEASYWCHTCSKKVKPVAEKKPEIVCGECEGDFVELMEEESGANNETSTPVQPNVVPPGFAPPFVPPFFNMFQNVPVNNVQFFNFGNLPAGNEEEIPNPLNGIQQFLNRLVQQTGEREGANPIG